MYKNALVAVRPGSLAATAGLAAPAPEQAARFGNGLTDTNPYANEKLLFTPGEWNA